MKNKTIIQLSVLSLLLVSGLVFYNATTVGKVIGKIEGIMIEGKDYYVYGWACQKDSNKPIGLHLYAGGAFSKGTLVARGSTTLVAEDDVVSTCGSSSESKHRFKLKIPDTILSQHGGKSLVVHGIAAFPGVPNDPITNSEIYRYPHPLSSAPMGCMQTGMNIKDTRNTYQTEYSQAQGSEWIYVAWTWRETPDAATSHSLSVARTQDMKNWYNTCGEKLTLPINSDARAVLDPILPYNGIINGVKLGFDQQARPVITFHKHKYIFSTTQKPIVTTQVYNTRLEDSGWKTYQMTNWTLKADQNGGGSLGKNDTTPRYGGIVLNRNNEISLSLTRPAGDKVGTPASGVYKIIDINGVMTVTTEKLAPLSADSFSPVVPSVPAKDLAVVNPNSNWETPFVNKRMAARFDDRWIMLRGRWDGGAANQSGVFDRKTRKFTIRDGADDKHFLFGPGSIPMWPMVYDWDGDGVDTIGVHDSVTNKMFIKNSFEGGSGDSLTGKITLSKLRDGTERWYSVNPSLLYHISYQTLPVNRDAPYDCQGRALEKQDATIVDQCPEKFLSDLFLHSYDTTKKVWTKTLIDKDVWGIGGSFAFTAFKRYLIVAYYDSNRQVKVAMRHQDKPWEFQVLEGPKYKGWDSHNYITMTVDENHHIHISGDQHVNGLNYWRSKGLTQTFRRFPMTKVAEDRVTYPTFFRSPTNTLLFQYRDGSSGDGTWIINQYDQRKQVWSRFLSTNLFGNN